MVLEDANLSKLELANKIKNFIPELKIHEDKNRQDPDKINYIVSNKKILNTGFKMDWTLDRGILELIKGIKILKNFDDFVNAK